MSYGAANPSAFDVDVELGSAASSHQHATTAQPRSLRPFAVRKRVEADDSASNPRVSRRSAILTVGLVAVACVAGVAGIKSGAWSGSSGVDGGEEMVESSHKTSSKHSKDIKVSGDEMYGGENPFWGGVGAMDAAADSGKEDTKVTADEIYGGENPFYGVGKASSALEEVAEEDAGEDVGDSPSKSKAGNGNKNEAANAGEPAESSEPAQAGEPAEPSEFANDGKIEAHKEKKQTQEIADSRNPKSSGCTNSRCQKADTHQAPGNDDDAFMAPVEEKDTSTDKKQAWLDKKKAAAFDEVSEEEASGDGGYGGFVPPSIPDDGSSPSISKVGNGNSNVNGNGKRA